MLLVTTGFNLFSNPLRCQWVQTNGPYANSVHCLTSVDTVLFAGTDDGVFRSTDSGDHWIQVNNGLTDYSVNSLAAMGPKLFAGTGGGVFVTTDYGTNWSAMNQGLTDYDVITLVADKPNLFAGVSSGVFLSKDEGASWGPIDSGIVRLSVTGNLTVSCLAAADSIICVAALEGLFVSSDLGTNWTLTSLDWAKEVSIMADSGRMKLYVRTAYDNPWGPIYCLDSGGLNWNCVMSQATCFAVEDTLLFAESIDGVFYSKNRGSTWTDIGGGFALAASREVSTFFFEDSIVYAGTLHSGVWRSELSSILSGVTPGTNHLPAGFLLLHNYPNPFNPSTVIDYKLPVSCFVSLEVYDVLGKSVATLVNEYQRAGSHWVIFQASQMTSGVYLCRLQAGTCSKTQKILFLK